MTETYSLPTQGLAERRPELASIIHGFPAHSPPFDYLIGWSSDFENILAGDYDRQTDIDGMLDQGLQTGRVLLQAEGGAGKSTILRRLFALASAREVYPVLVDLRNWRAPHEQARITHADDRMSLMAILLEQLGMPPVGEIDLGRLTDNGKYAVLIDGLNEVTPDVGASIIRAADAFAQRMPSAAVIVTDRLARRPIAANRWRLATVSHVGGKVVERLRAQADDASKRLLRTAYFLDRVLQDGLEAASSSEVHRLYFSRHVRLDQVQVARAARAAFDAYKRHSSRLFDPEQFSRVAGSDVFKTLVQSGTILSEGGSVFFSHHLQHDYLAAMHVATHRRLWKHASFDAITLQASSFDSPAMALEQLKDQRAADLFVRKIYDWNFYAAAYVIAKGHQSGAVHVSEAMQTAILALLAERRWDPMEATAERVTDALHLFPPAQASPFLEAEDLENVFEVVQGAKGNDWFEEWRRLFVTPPGTTGKDLSIAALAETDSLTGWTLANVLKRVRLEPEQQRHLRTLLVEGEEVTRWRAVHALGAHPSIDNANAVLRALDDKYDWVKYGAVRSAVELAALGDTEVRREVLAYLGEKMPSVGNRDLHHEFGRAIFLRDAPPDWLYSVGPVVEAVWAAAKSSEEQDYWVRVASALEARYGTKDDNADVP